MYKGLFGRNHSEEESMDIISLEIEKIKGILTMAESSIPASKRDMLNFALKDKEMQLRSLRELQEARKAAELAKKAD